MTDDVVRVRWRVTSALGADEVAGAAVLLSPDEQARAERLRFREDARDYVIAHALLRQELSSARTTAPAAWTFDRGEHGKPFLSGGAAGTSSFSLSHTRGLVACALGPASVAIGVDVESNERDIDALRLAARFFASSEVAAIAALPEPAQRERFYDLWTVKEAVVKALGLALPAALAEVTVEISGGADIVLTRTPAPPDSAWQLALITPAPGYRLAAAVLRPSTSPPLAISCAQELAQVRSWNRV